MTDDEVTFSAKPFKYLMDIGDSFTPFVRVERTEHKHQDNDVYGPWLYFWW